MGPLTEEEEFDGGVGSEGLPEEFQGGSVYVSVPKLLPAKEVCMTVLSLVLG